MHPAKIYARFKKRKDNLYLKWIRRQFRRFGERSTVFQIDNLTNAHCMEIGDDVHIGHHCVLEAFKKLTPTPSITIGDRTSNGDYCHLGAAVSIKIGNDVLMGRFVLVEDHNHGNIDRETLDIPPIRRPLVSKGGITIGDRVWIGDKVTILSGVSIGEGAIIGANSVVTKDVPPYSVAAGIPAKVIRNV